MKLQAIKKCCNEYGTYDLLTCPDGQQWIGNGAAFWPVEGITLTEEAIPAIFDITGKKREETAIRAAEITDDRFQIVPVGNEEALLDLGAVISGGNIYRVLESVHGVLLINTDLEKPAQKGQDDLRYYIRPREGKGALVAIYADLFVSGLVAPLTGKGAQRVLDGLAKIGCRRARAIVKADTEPDEETGEQLSMEEENEH